MDKKTLISKLNAIFCQHGKKYAEIWLEESSYGGLYVSDKFSLFVRSQDNNINRVSEIKEIVFFLHEKARDVYQVISEVIVYGYNDKIHCPVSDLMVYEDKATYS